MYFIWYDKTYTVPYYSLLSGRDIFIKERGEKAIVNKTNFTLS